MIWAAPSRVIVAMHRPVLGGLLVLAVGCADVTPGAPTGTVTQAILGTQRSASAYPEAVRIQVNNADGDFCTGTIVAPRVVLTAAHCVIFNANDDGAGPHGTWTVVAQYAPGAPTRTASSAEPSDPAFPKTGYDSQDEHIDLGYLSVDTPFTGINFPTLASGVQAKDTKVSAIGRQTTAASAGLVLSGVTTILAPDPSYTKDYKTGRVTTDGDSGGGLFVDGTHTLVGGERLYNDTANPNFDIWVQYAGATFTQIGQKIASHGGNVLLTPATAQVEPGAKVTLTVSNGSTGTLALTTNASGGSLAGTVYTAGATRGTIDVITATDARGNKATATLRVGGAADFPLAIQGGGSTVPPRGAVDLVAFGGTGKGYAWSLERNDSGGTIDDAGHYVAGPKGDVRDTVALVDDSGTKVTIEEPVGPSLAIVPGNQSVEVRANVTLSATGGASSGYSFTLDTNLSGATLDGTSYTAGPREGIDLVTAHDALGNAATATITVRPAAEPMPTPAAAEGEDSGGCRTGRGAPGRLAPTALAALALLFLRRRRA